jgi:hypothetical protein
VVGYYFFGNFGRKASFGLDCLDADGNYLENGGKFVLLVTVNFC